MRSAAAPRAGAGCARAAAEGARAAAGREAGAAARLLGTREFLGEVGKAGGFKRDVAAFHERWVAGRGCPHLTAAFEFLRSMSTTRFREVTAVDRG